MFNVKGVALIWLSHKKRQSMIISSNHCIKEISNQFGTLNIYSSLVLTWEPFGAVYLSSVFLLFEISNCFIERY